MSEDFEARIRHQREQQEEIDHRNNIRRIEDELTQNALEREALGVGQELAEVLMRADFPSSPVMENKPKGTPVTKYKPGFLFAKKYTAVELTYEYREVGKGWKIYEGIETDDWGGENIFGYGLSESGKVFKIDYVKKLAPTRGINIERYVVGDEALQLLRSDEIMAYITRRINI